MLEAPEDLTDAEAAVWARTAQFVGVPGAGELLRAWCASVVELRDAEAWVREHGTTITLRDDKGNVKSIVQAPKYVQARALRGDLVRLADALGLSAKARALVKDSAGPVGGSPLDELARRRGDRRADAAGGGRA